MGALSVCGMRSVRGMRMLCVRVWVNSGGGAACRQEQILRGGELGLAARDEEVNPSPPPPLSTPPTPLH